jgi:hypothetical protein
MERKQRRIEGKQGIYYPPPQKKDTLEWSETYILSHYNILRPLQDTNNC